MTTEVMEGIPFALQFGENPQDWDIPLIVDDSSYSLELQLRVNPGTDQPTYQVTERPDGRLTFMYPDNRHTRRSTKNYLDGKVSYDIRGD
ncbi:MAG: hypothetical protein OXD31_03590 [Chloroflexi bacterium]|nr:hypothetical protein [Chloroflexota bacterium]